MNRNRKHLKDLQFARRLTFLIIVVVIVLYLIITLSVFSDTGSSGDLPAGGEANSSNSIESVLIEGFPVNLRRNSNS